MTQMKKRTKLLPATGGRIGMASNLRGMAWMASNLLAMASNLPRCFFLDPAILGLVSR